MSLCRHSFGLDDFFPGLDIINRRWPKVIKEFLMLIMITINKVSYFLMMVVVVKVLYILLTSPLCPWAYQSLSHLKDEGRDWERVYICSPSQKHHKAEPGLCSSLITRITSCCRNHTSRGLYSRRCVVLNSKWTSLCLEVFQLGCSVCRPTT